VLWSLVIPLSDFTPTLLNQSNVMGIMLRLFRFYTAYLVVQYSNEHERNISAESENALGS